MRLHTYVNRELISDKKRHYIFSKILSRPANTRASKYTPPPRYRNGHTSRCDMAYARHKRKTIDDARR